VNLSILHKLIIFSDKENMNWWNFLIVILLLVILSLEVVNYIHIQNNATQLQLKGQATAQKIDNIEKNTDNLEEKLSKTNSKSVQAVSDNCVSIFKEIFVH